MVASGCEKKKELHLFCSKNLLFSNEKIIEDVILDVWFKHSSGKEKYGILFMTNRALRFWGSSSVLTYDYWFTYLYEEIESINYQSTIQPLGSLYDYCGILRISGNERYLHQNIVLNNYGTTHKTFWEIWIDNQDEMNIEKFCSNLKKISIKRQMFVAMPFQTMFEQIYTAIQEICSKRNITCLRIDSSQTLKNIDEEIRQEIRESHFVLADLTDLNPNVMIEYGFAEALGKKIICIAKAKQKLPFDMANKRTLFYEISEAGIESFKRQLLEILIQSESLNYN